jgi:hypothetical protein
MLLVCFNDGNVFFTRTKKNMTYALWAKTFVKKNELLIIIALPVTLLCRFAEIIVLQKISFSLHGERTEV